MTITRNQLLTALAVLGIPGKGTISVDATVDEVTVKRISRTEDGQPIYDPVAKRLQFEYEVIPVEGDPDTDQATPIFDGLERLYEIPLSPYTLDAVVASRR